MKNVKGTATTEWKTSDAHTTALLKAKEKEVEDAKSKGDQAKLNAKESEVKAKEGGVEQAKEEVCSSSLRML